MGTVDVVIVIVWIIISFLIGVIPGFKANFDGFWLNNKKTKRSALIFTIVATQVGGATIIGISSSTFKDGLGFGLVALASTVIGFIIIGIYAPKIKNIATEIQAYTLADIIGNYYGKTAQRICGLIILIAYFSLLASQIVSTTTLINVWSGVAFNSALWIAGITMLVYCAFAGLKGDIASDIFHFWGMLIFYFIILLPIILLKENVISLLSSLTWDNISPIKFGGYTYLIAGIFFGAIIPLVSMELWLRIFAAENPTVAKKAYIASAITIVPFYLLPMLIGLISISTIPSISNPDNILVTNYLKYLPSGILGLGIASLFSVTISTANTYIVVLSSTFYKDILRLGNNNKDSDLKNSRIITLFIGIVGIAFAMLLPNVVQLILTGFFVIAIIFPTLAYGFFAKKGLNPYSGIISLTLGFILTVGTIPFLANQAFVPGILGSIIGIMIGIFINKRQKNHA
jgi:solute:Na+ symporter, SSS family